MSTKNTSSGYRRPVPKADSLTKFMCPLSRNLGSSTSWACNGLAQGLLCLYYYYISRDVEVSAPSHTPWPRVLFHSILTGTQQEAFSLNRLTFPTTILFKDSHFRPLCTKTGLRGTQKSTGRQARDDMTRWRHIRDYVIVTRVVFNSPQPISQLSRDQ